MNLIAGWQARAILRSAELQGANLTSAQLQGADLTRAQLQGADLGYAEIWLVSFPDDLDNQSLGSLGVADLDISAPTADDRVRLKKSLQAKIADEQLLAKVIERLDPILRDDPPEWRDEESWKRYRSEATDPPIVDLVDFLAGMACQDRAGHIAKTMAQQAVLYSKIKGRRQYAMPLAEALLDENCEGTKALSDERRAALENLVSAAE